MIDTCQCCERRPAVVRWRYWGVCRECYVWLTRKRRV
jgi:hypothetical protein